MSEKNGIGWDGDKANSKKYRYIKLSPEHSSTALYIVLCTDTVLCTAAGGALLKILTQKSYQSQQILIRNFNSDKIETSSFNTQRRRGRHRVADGKKKPN